MVVRRICGRTRGKYFCLVVKLQAQRRPDSEQIEPAGAKPLRRNSVSVEQIQDARRLTRNRSLGFARKILIFRKPNFL